MNPFIPTPDPLPIPAPAPLFMALLLLTFVLHLLAMNALLGGLVLSAASWFARQREGDLHDRLLDRVAKLLPTLFAATVTLGVAPLLFLQVLYGSFFYTSSILMAWPWFLLVVVLILAYYGTYLNSFRGPRLGRARGWVIVTTALLTAWVGFLYTHNTTLMLRPETWAAHYFAAPGGTLLNQGDPVVWPRYLHMLLGATAMAGVFLALLARSIRDDDALRGFFTRRGVGVFLWATLLNAGVGTWHLLVLREDVMKRFMGGSPHATGLFGVGFLLALVLLALAWRARRDGRGLVPLFGVACAEMVVMVLMRHEVREAMLGAASAPGDFPVHPQVLNLGLFGVLLAGGVAVVVWMVRKLLAAPRG